MKKNTIAPLILIALIMALVISACNLLGGDKEEAPAEAPQVIIITATPKVEAPVATEPPAVVATEPPAVAATEPPPVVVTEPPAVVPTAQPLAVTDAPASGGMYFRDEFDNGLDIYDRFIFKQDEFKIYRNNENLERKVKAELKDGYIRFDIQEYWVDYYFIYDAQVYEDVKVSVEIENLGYNASTASLVCRYDPDMGWYQVLIDGSGQWALYYYDGVNKKFNYLTNGGAAEFNYGKDTNKYTLVCKGKEISFYVNDVFSQTYENKDLKRGKVGFTVQSPATYTLMNANWFEISEP